MLEIIPFINLKACFCAQTTMLGNTNVESLIFSVNPLDLSTNVYTKVISTEAGHSPVARSFLKTPE